MNPTLRLILIIAATVLFVFGFYFAVVDDTPDPQQVEGALFAGLACFAGAHI